MILYELNCGKFFVKLIKVLKIVFSLWIIILYIIILLSGFRMYFYRKIMFILEVGIFIILYILFCKCVYNELSYWMEGLWLFFVYV